MSWHTSLVVLFDFFFNSLVVRAPCSLIFWHFWLFIDFGLVVILLLVVQGSSGFLPTPLSWPDVFCFLVFHIIALIHSFIILPLIPCKLFFISISMSFVSAWVFFILLRHLLSSLCILITNVLNRTSDQWLISILFSSFLGVLICSFIWAMFLYLIITPSLCSLLCIG